MKKDYHHVMSENVTKAQERYLRGKKIKMGEKRNHLFYSDHVCESVKITASEVNIGIQSA